MDIKDLEKEISQLKITKPKHRGEDVENRSLPFMLSTFRELIQNEIPPTQDKFLHTFKAKYPDLKMRGITSRLKRAYLSYVREYHLGYVLKKHFRKVIYDEKIDIAGVDYVIYYRGRKFNIHAFVNTENGKYWREIKNGRHKFRGEHLDLPMDLDRGKKCGKLILYTDDQVLNLKKEMDKIIKARRRSDIKRQNSDIQPQNSKISDIILEIMACDILMDKLASVVTFENVARKTVLNKVLIY